MKKKDVLKIWNALGSFNEKTNVAFAYFLAKNKLLIEDEIKVIKEVSKPLQESIDFEKERIALIAELGKRDDEGSIAQKNGQYIIEETNKSEFDERFNKIQEKYGNIKEKIQEHNKQISDLMNEEIEIDFYKISMDNIPEEIEPETMEILLKNEMILD